MIRAAADVLPNTLITAVTVLTSLGCASIESYGFTGRSNHSGHNPCQECGGKWRPSIVCSPLEVAAIKSALGDRAVLITPGVRMASSMADDQKRVMSPAQAIAAGSNYLVSR